MKAAAIAASGLFAALLLTHCRERDPQAAALTDLSQRGYHLATDSFHLAAAEGDVAALDLFLRAGVSVDLPASPQEPGRTALRAAAEASQVEAFHWLLDHGASIDAADRSGTPLLSVAIEQGSEPLARALIERWPAEDPHTQEELLHTALQHDSPALWTLLLDRFDGPLDSSLLQAARIGQLPALDLLLRRGADPWSRDPLTAGTALHLAAAAGHAACVRYLIDRGADRFLLDANQHLAADVALENDHPDIADPLWTPPTPEEREIGVLPGTVSPDQAVRSLADFPAITPHEVGQPRVLLPLLQARIGRISGSLARPPAPPPPPPPPNRPPPPPPPPLLLHRPRPRARPPP
ncbi:MAG: ankyrin repeat domain-containing protein, partial [Verrucomicrobiales bacterium]|nr:ankyrin repeat domain-containing protein [Verrucomicrobiales bacterium]